MSYGQSDCEPPSSYSNLYIRGREITRGRPQDDLLCARCQNGQVMERTAPKGVKGNVVVWCRHIGRPVPHDIVKCSGFTDAKVMSLNEMHMIALDVTGDEHHANEAFNAKSYL